MNRPRDLRVDFHGEADTFSRMRAVCALTVDQPLSWGELWEMVRGPLAILAGIAIVGYAVSRW